MKSGPGIHSHSQQGTIRTKKESESEIKSTADDLDHAITHKPSRKRESNAEKQREYRQRKKNENISEEKKIKVETQEFAEKLSQESQHSLSQVQVKVETVAGTTGTIQNLPDSLEGPQRKQKSNAEKQREKNENISEEKKIKVETQRFAEQESPHSLSRVHIKVETVAGTSGTIQNVPDSLEGSQRKRKSNAEKQREYRQRKKNKNILEEKKRKLETQKLSKKINPDERKLRNAAYSKAYRVRKKISNILKLSKSQTQETQHSTSQIYIQVKTIPGTPATLQNVLDSLEGSQRQRKRKSNAEKQREYRQRKKNKNITEEKKRKRETPKITEKINPDECKIQDVAYSKTYRDRKNIANIESHTQLSQESQCAMSQIHTKVESLAGSSGTIQNFPVSSQELHSSEKLSLDELKLRNAAYSKAYRDRKKFQKFSNIESEIQSNKLATFLSHRHIQVDAIAETTGTIQNVPDSFEKSKSGLCQTSTSGYQMGNQADTIINKYKDYDRHVAARVLFHQQFTQNPFGHACKICDRLWFKNDLKLVKEDFKDLFRQIIENYEDGSTVAVCSTCYVSIKKNKIPNLSTYNGFKYPDFPTHLPKLDIISERLICPQLPFMQIKRLRHYGQKGQYKIYGQIINVPVEVNNMVRSLPRHLDDEQSLYIHIQKKLIHKSYYLRGLLNKQNIKIWLRFLVDTPLYKEYGISINENFFNSVDTQSYNNIDDVSEHIPVEETLTAQQQTLLWDKNKFLCIATDEGNNPVNLLFDEHAEELSFPAIYLGQFRKYEITVTPFMEAISELRRADRRGATPNHILYLAMKIMKMQVRDSPTVAFKHTSSSDIITKEQIMDKDYINTCIESNLAFLKSIPNSTWYWSSRKKDLFAMIRQLGKPTAFMTLSANEIKWIPLLKILHKLKNNCDEISTEAIEQLNLMERSDLVNEDPVTCAIYFNKLVKVLMTILMSKRNSPFGKYYVIHYFKRIEFQHRGSPHTHILLWLNNTPNVFLDKNYNQAIKIINSLSSVSASEASGNMKLNTHKHTDTCYEEITKQEYKKCRFQAPFMPSKQTVILSPMDKDDENYSTFRKQYARIRKNLESCFYGDFNDFYKQNSITSDQHYYDIIRAGIKRPKVFIKRLPTEKWHNPFNPFVFYLLQSSMDFQLILDEYSCAQFVVEYVNKNDRGISNLQKQIIQVMDEHPEFDIIEITRKACVEMLNTVEMSSQEAAWYLLQEPISKSSTAVVYIPTVLPHERKKIRKNMVELEKLDDESTDLWKENIFERYEKRPEYLNDVSLSQFVSKYYKKIKTSQYVQRKVPKIIRYRNYDRTENFNEYKREMVTLHIPFKNEQEDILLDSKYLNIYEKNRDIIMEKKKEFESDLDIENIMRICRQLCRDNNDFDDDSEVAAIIQKPDDHKR